MTDLTKLKRILAAATPGPYSIMELTDSLVLLTDSDDCKGLEKVICKRTVRENMDVEKFRRLLQTFNFFCHAITTMPALVAELEAAREKIERIRELAEFASKTGSIQTSLQMKQIIAITKGEA